MKRITLIAAAMLGACTVGPDYHRADIAQSPVWRNANIGVAQGTSPWWSAFSDAQLDALEVEALRGNLDVAQALARMEQARAAEQLVMAAAWPAGVLDAARTRTRQSLNSGFGRLVGALPGLDRMLTQTSAVIATTWDLDFAGAVRRQREAARAQRDAAGAAEAAVRIAVSAEVADAYLGIAGGLAQRQAVARQLALLQDQLGILKTRLQVGDVSRTAVDLASADVDRASADLPLLDAVIESQRVRLAVLLGRDPSDPQLSTLTAVVPDTATDPVAGVPADLLRRRPDLVAAEMRLVAANAGIGAALAEYYPRVALGLLAGQDAVSPAELMSAKSNLLQGGVSLRWRLFDFARIDAQVALARGQQKEALAAYRASVLQATAEVETAFAQLRELHQRRHSLEAAHADQCAAERRAAQAFAIGAISRDEWLTAQRGVAATEALLVEARQQLARALVASARAVGGPMPPEEIALATAD